MHCFQKPEASIIEEKNAHLSIVDVRDLMRIESEAEDTYIPILCDLFDESIQYNDSKKVNDKSIDNKIAQDLTVFLSRRDSSRKMLCMTENK